MEPLPILPSVPDWPEPADPGDLESSTLVPAATVRALYLYLATVSQYIQVQYERCGVAHAP
jgi:hypothetical protein